MSVITIIARDGSEREVEGQAGISIMEIAREAGLDELMALCGGCCSCATCHIYVEDGPIGRLSQMTSDEDDLLDSSEHRDARSRLACQIIYSNALAGLRMRIAPED
ncbi:2Fe-2S iron-sulfur cluster-binding protein [Sphingobium sp.]|uniref:2Fe-2S iron-sulfur cluster-binding protein n=1 Tax=Sphingobium sp. TaxID=1912891 RepID=UPI000DB62CA3|nr:2Fe-2S iron-sulfur cluster-binding protein [Sphingobium sp.]PZU64596.1 MAG: ferredoxin [Sphingobium sp.]